MKKRNFITLLAVVFCVLLAAGIAACHPGGPGGSTHIHSYSDKWSCDTEYHWHDPVCYHSADEDVPVADKAPHEYEDGVCKVCKYIDDLLIVPQSRKLIEDKIAPVLFADRDEKTILSQNWQLITDNKNEYLTGLAATYIYATEEHTHVVNIDTISFTKFSLENLVGAKLSEFDKDSIKTENKKSLTASLIKTWEVNADEQRKAEALKNLSVADGYENTVRTLFADADGKNFLLECNAGTTRINSSAYADTKIEGRQVTELEYTVREHKYTTDNLCAATNCGYDGLKYEEIEGGYAITGTGELDKSKLKILNLSPTHKDRTVKKIGNDAFSGCTNLETVRIIGNKNAYIEEIGSRAFEGCKRLYDFAWRKSLKSIGEYAFKDCVSLYRVQLEGTPQIGSGAFSGCRKIIEVYCMYDDLTEGSSSYGGIASYAKHVYGPNIEGHKNDSSRVWKSVNGDSEPFAGATFIFYNNKQENYLIGLDGGSFNFTTTDKLILPKKLAYLGYSTEKYEVYDYAFAHFDEIKSVEIPESATAVASTAFDGCDNLESIETAEENTAYASQDGILYNKNKTQIIFVPKAIKSVTLPDGITDIGNAFANCANLESITVTDNNTAYASQDGILYNKDKTEFVLIPKAIKGAVTIPNSVTSIGDRAFEKRTGLTSVTIGNGVTSIGNDAFYDCTAEIQWGDNPTIKEIGEHAFEGYKGTSITIPNSVASIGYEAFENCTNLTSVTIGNGVTSIGYYAFDGCYKLVEVVNLSSLPITKGNSDCGSVAKYAKDVYNTAEFASKIKTQGDYIFYEDGKTVYLLGYKGNNTELQLPDKFGGKTYKIYGYAFYNNDKVTKVTIPDSITSIAYAFYGCTSLTSITIPDSVTSIGERAFENCTSLTSITIPDSVTSIGERAFENCTSLKEITIPNSITSIGVGAFSYCKNLEGVYITDIKAWCKIDFGNYYADPFNNANPLYYAHNLYLNNQLVTKLTAEMLQGVTTIKDWAFYECESLESITIPDGVTSIGERAFENCTSLKEITIPDSVTSIGQKAFESCTAEIKWGDNPSIKEIGISAFYGYKGTSITIPKSVTSIGGGAFDGCKNLTSITIPNSVTSIGDRAFCFCTNLTSVTIPDSVTSIGGGAFEYCTNLESVTLGNGVTFIGHEAFAYCNNLSSVTFNNPNGWYVTKDYSATSGTDISSEDLQKPQTAATYLKDTYSNYYWERKS